MKYFNKLLKAAINDGAKNNEYNKSTIEELKSVFLSKKIKLASISERIIR